MPIRRFPVPDHPGSQIVWDASADADTLPIPTVIPRDVPDPMTPLHDALFAVFGMGGRHALNPSREVPAVGRHGDDDLDGTVNQSDSDWRPDARDEHAHDDDGCDQHQQQPDRWIGATRDPDFLPATETTDG